MEQIKIPTIADDYLYKVESDLHLLQADGERRDRYLEEMVKGLKKYLSLREIEEYMGRDKFVANIEGNKDLEDFFDKYDSAFGKGERVEYLFGLSEFAEYLRRVEALS